MSNVIFCQDLCFLVAAASRKLADAELSIFIKWPPCYSSHDEPPGADLGLLRPAPDKIHDQVTRIDGDAVGITGQIVENMLRTIEGRLGINHPVFTEELSKKAAEALLHGRKSAMKVKHMTWGSPALRRTAETGTPSLSSF
jgi:hypothetical protein